MKKALSVVCAIVLLLGAMAGCSGSQPQTSSSAPSSASAAPNSQAAPSSSAAPVGDVSIRFMLWTGDVKRDDYLRAIEVFEKKNPNITVELEPLTFSGFHQKILTQLAASAMPDLVQLDAPWYPDFSKRGDIFVDLYEQDILDISQFDQDFLKEFGDFGNGLLGVPAGLNSTAFIVNEQLFGSLGLDASRLEYGYTFEDWITFAHEINQANPDTFLFNMDTGSAYRAIKMYLMQRTGKPAFQEDFTRGFEIADLIEVYDWLNRLYDAGGCIPIDEAMIASVPYQSSYWTNEKALGEIGLAGSLPSRIGTLPEGRTMLAFPYPVLEDGVMKQSEMVRPMFMHSVPKTTPEKEAAALLFLQGYHYDPDMVDILAPHMCVGAVPIQREIGEATGKANPQALKQVNAALGRMQPSENPVLLTAELETFMKDEIARLLYKEGTPEQIAGQTIAQVDEILARLKAAA